MTTEPKKQVMLGVAIELAASYHAHQYDKAGVPYIMHCIKVMKYLRSEDEELNCIAVLHDILEDTGCEEEELRFMGMSERVINGIKALTKIGNISTEDYLKQIKANPDAIKVKMTDLLHNSDIRRLKDVRQKDFDRIVKYHAMYQELKKTN